MPRNSVKKKNRGNKKKKTKRKVKSKKTVKIKEIPEEQYNDMIQDEIKEEQYNDMIQDEIKEANKLNFRCDLLVQAHWLGQNDTETLRHWIQYKFQGTIYSAVGDCLDLAMKLHYNAATNLDDIKQDLQSKNSAIIIYAYNHLNKPS
eukprot:283069_1